MSTNYWAWRFYKAGNRLVAAEDHGTEAELAEAIEAWWHLGEQFVEADRAAASALRQIAGVGVVAADNVNTYTLKEVRDIARAASTPNADSASGGTIHECTSCWSDLRSEPHKPGCEAAR